MSVSVISRGTTNVRLKAALGIPGPQGEKGWSPLLSAVTDGARRVLRVVDWTGGAGTKPATGSYIGATGLVTDIADAVDIRGAQGIQGETGPQGPQGEQGLPASSEVIDDRVAQLLTAGANVSLAYDDLAGTLQVSVPTETVQDLVAGFLAAGPNVAFSYDDAGNSFAISVPNEVIDDRVAALLTAGTGISLTYNDAGNAIIIATTSLDVVLVSSGTIPSGVSTADISLPSGSKAYHLKVWGLATGMQTDIGVRFSHDNGATYDAMGYVYTGADYKASGHIPINSASATFLPIINNAVDASSCSGRLVDMRISTTGPGGGSYRGLITVNGAGSEPTNPAVGRLLWGVGPSKATPITNIRLIFSLPSAAGAKWALYKLQEGA